MRAITNGLKLGAAVVAGELPWPLEDRDFCLLSHDRIGAPSVIDGIKEPAGRIKIVAKFVEATEIRELRGLTHTFDYISMELGQTSATGVA
ncbi:hypothetical protein ABID19_005015 [Mesorhizobium robiniae]|uniref:Uncharacterized protein n=1 Tax=Mesorhizobium robiniae TaxID=559315 RepID=A0ABV2GV17_9HYPH